MTKKCTKIDITFGAIVNILIVISFLSAFFIIYASKLEREILREKLGIIINTNMKSFLDKTNIDSGGDLKKILVTAKPILDKIVSETSVDSKSTQIFNEAVEILAYIMIGIIILVILVILITMYMTMGKICLNIKNIFIESLITFIFIGLIEFLFFFYIARYYVPISASSVMEIIISEIKKSQNLV